MDFVVVRLGMLVLVAIMICFLSLMGSTSIVEHSCRLRCGITEVNKAKKII